MSHSNTRAHKVNVAPQRHSNEEIQSVTATLQPSRSGRDRRASDKLAAQLSEKQEAAKKKAELMRLRTERQRVKARKQAIPSDNDDGEDLDERPNTTFVSKIVAAKPATLVQRVNKVPPASRKVVPEDVNNAIDHRKHRKHTAITHPQAAFPQAVSRSPSLPDQHQSLSKTVGADEDTSEDDTSDHNEENSWDNNEEMDDDEENNFNVPTLSAGLRPGSQPTSHDNSPEVQSKRKRHESATSSDSETDTGHVKAQKINRNAGRPRAADYNDLAKDLILQAATLYRCLLSTQDAFPDLAHEAEMVKMAWTQVNTETGFTPLALTPDIAKIIKARGSQARGEIKEKTKALVEGLYGFDSGNGRKAIAANRKWAEELKREKGFVYKTIFINLETEDSERKGMYQHPIIQKAVNVMWFQNKRDEGVQFIDMFKPIPIAAIALVLTAVEANIDEWLTGIKVPVTFWADEYRPIYSSHIEGLKEYGQHTTKYNLLGRLQRRLYNYGCHHAGIPPNELDSKLQHTVPVSAYAAALKEYEDGNTTESDSEGDTKMS